MHLVRICTWVLDFRNFVSVCCFTGWSCCFPLGCFLFMCRASDAGTLARATQLYKARYTSSGVVAALCRWFCICGRLHNR